MKLTSLKWVLGHHIVTFLIFFASADPAQCGAFIVHNTSGCSDSVSSGTEAKPWCSINYALSRVTAGDTVLVKAAPNPYLQSSIFIVGLSGTQSNPITLRAFPGERPHIRGEGATNWGWIKFQNASHWVFEGFEISNYGMALRFENSSNIVVRNNFMHDSVNQLVSVVYNSHDILFENNTLEKGGSIFYTPRNRYENGEGFYLGNQNGGDYVHHITIRGNTISDMQADCIELKADSHDVVIENNILDACMQDDHCEASNNWASCYGYSAIEVQETKQYTQNPNHVIRGNIIRNQSSRVSGRYGIGLRTGADVYNNVIYSMTNNAIGIAITNGDSHTPRIYHNTIDLASSLAVSGGQNADVKNNIGPTSTGNIATSDGYYVNKAAADYQLRPAAAPVNAGTNVGIVTDKDGNPRVGAPDLGAYEFGTSGSTTPAAPTRLRVVP